jgi:hypothetical protein
MAVRRITDPPIIPSPLKELTRPTPAAADQPIYGYLTDSLETNKVRTSVRAGTTVEIRCALTSRPLTLTEEQAFRNEGALPDGVGTSPSDVGCTIERPAGDSFDLEVGNEGGGVYSTRVVVDSYGTWRYVFACPGGLAVPVSKVIPVKRQARV